MISFRRGGRTLPPTFHHPNIAAATFLKVTASAQGGQRRRRPDAPPSLGSQGESGGPERPNHRACHGGPASISACFLSETFRCPGSLQPITPALFPTLGGLLWALRVRGRPACVPVKETSASLSCPSSWTLSLSDLEPPRARFMLRKYWPQRCRPASFLSRFSLARRFWNHTCGAGVGERPRVWGPIVGGLPSGAAGR